MQTALSRSGLGKAVAMQVDMETGSKGAMALTGQTTTLGKEALTGKLTILYSHTLHFTVNVRADVPAQDALQTSLQHHVNLASCVVQHAELVSGSACCHCAIVTLSHRMCQHGLLSMRLHPARSRGGGYSRDYESSDRGRGGGGFRDDRGGFPDRGQADRGDRRGFGSNYEQDDRRGGSFRDRPRGDYGNLLPFAPGPLH